MKPIVWLFMLLVLTVTPGCSNEENQDEESVDVTGKYPAHFAGVEIDGLLPFFVNDSLGDSHFRYDHTFGAEREDYEAEAYWLEITPDTTWYLEQENGERETLDPDRGRAYFDYPNQSMTVTFSESFEQQSVSLPAHVSWAPEFLPVEEALSVTIHPYRMEDYLHYNLPGGEDSYLYWLFDDVSDYDQQFLRQYAYSLYLDEGISLNYRFISDTESNSARLMGIDSLPYFIIVNEEGIVAESDDRAAAERKLAEEMGIRIFDHVYTGH